MVGFGVVGRSFGELIQVRKSELLEDYGLNLKIVGVADRGGVAVNERGLDLKRLLEAKKKSGTVASMERFGSSSKGSRELIKEVDAEVVIESTPTNILNGEPGLTYIKQALISKKNVVTTNKGPLAHALPALMELAEHNAVRLRFSGTVGGGTPILEFGKRCLMVDRIVGIEGILNGTTNFILTRMASEGLSFEEGLNLAQKLGYAEADPSLDVDGYDTAAKIVILANWLMEREVTLKDVSINGIRGVTKEDLGEALNRGKTIKLIGSIDGRIEVKPREVDRHDPICVDDTLNAVRFRSEFAGQEVIIGKGAGGIETASAVLRDTLDIRDSIVGR